MFSVRAPLLRWTSIATSVRLWGRAILEAACNRQTREPFGDRPLENDETGAVTRRQRLERNPLAPSSEPSSKPDVSRRIAESERGGSALDPQSRVVLESRLGHQFSDVRVHDDSLADDLTRDFGARAFALGQHVFFRSDELAPESPAGLRLLAHEVAHVAQNKNSDLDLPHDPEVAPRDTSQEREADAAADVVLGSTAPAPPTISPSVTNVVQRWPWDDDPPAGSAPASSPGILDSLGSLASGAASGIGKAATTAYEGYEKSTDFKGLFGQMNKGIDWAEKKSAEGNQKMVEDSKGHWYEGLAKGSAWLNNTTTEITGGVLKGGGDIVGGLAGAIAHPIDAAGGLLGIAEHDLPMVGSVLKAGHGLADLGLGAMGVHYEGQGQYGNSFGQLANHLFNPLQQSEDDAKFNTNLVQGIVDPDKKGWKGFTDKPAESIARAVTNILPMVLGAGEAAAGEEGANAARAAGDIAPTPSLGEPPTLKSPINPDLPVPKPPPDVPIVDPGTPGVPVPDPAPIPAGPKTLRSPGVVDPSVVPSSQIPDVPSFPSSDVAPSAPKAVDPSVPSSPASPPPNGPQTAVPSGNNSSPFLDRGDPPPSTPPQFKGQQRPFPGKQPEIPPPDPSGFGVISDIPLQPPSQIPPTLPSPFLPPGVPAPPPAPIVPFVDPAIPGTPIPEPAPVPAGPGTLRSPVNEAPNGPVTLDAPSQVSDVPTQRGIGPIRGPAIPRGTDPGLFIDLLLGRPEGGSLLELLKEYGEPVDFRP